MKKIIIVSPHFPPSNLAAVHRSRLFANHLPQYGWEPIIVCVDEKYYEEELDYQLEQLLPDSLRIEKVNAFRVNRKTRLIGDIGLRGFLQMRNRIVQIIKNEHIDFLYITIPSFYGALLGRAVNLSVPVKYGIDYIDPWVHRFPGSQQIFSRHWWSTQIAKWLEPIAIKNASLITGVAEGYYAAVLDRNPHLRKQCTTLAMPYGGEATDFDKLARLNTAPYLFSKREGVVDVVYAGAMLPKANQPLRAFFRVLAQNINLFQQVRFHFIGTGKTPNDPQGYNIKPYAEEAGIWNSLVFEYPKRIPYLDVLKHLMAADIVFILGSTEPHYTPSKVFQGVLSKKPIFALLHEQSTACEVIQLSGAGKVLSFNADNCENNVLTHTLSQWLQFEQWRQSFTWKAVNRDYFNQYSAQSITAQLAEVLNTIE